MKGQTRHSMSTWARATWHQDEEELERGEREQGRGEERGLIRVRGADSHRKL